MKFQFERKTQLLKLNWGISLVEYLTIIHRSGGE